MSKHLNYKSLSYKDVILRHGYGKLSSRSLADISVYLGAKKFASPACIANMPSIQTYDILKTLDDNRWPYVYHRFGDTLSFLRQINQENWYSKSISIGVKNSDYELLYNIKEEKLDIDILTLDVAFCYAEHVKTMIKFARKLFPDVYLIVGNATQPEVVPWLENLGVNCFKQNIGVSLNCRTRQFSAFGSVTFSDLLKSTEIAKAIDICADGGLTMEDGEVWIGDVFKAIGAAGAKFVMSSSLFKQIKELENKNGYVECSGNASSMIKQNEEHVEGVTLSFKGSGRTLKQQMKLILDSLKSSVSYSGFTSLKDCQGLVKWDAI
jgi:GMP reductase